MLKKLKEDLNGHGRSFTLGQIVAFCQIIGFGFVGYGFVKSSAVTAAEDFVIQIADKQLVEPVKDELKMLRKSVEDANKDRNNIKKDINDLRQEIGTQNAKLDEILNRLPANQ